MLLQLALSPGLTSPEGITMIDVSLYRFPLQHLLALKAAW